MNVIFFNILNLAFLPAGLKLADKIKPVGVYVLCGIIEVPLHYFMTLYINIVDFALWIPAKIPVLNSVLKFIKTCPDKDLVTHGIDPLIDFFGMTGHRNAFTHSVLNPYIVIIVAICVVLAIVVGYFSESVSNFFNMMAVVTLMILSAHLFADAMPQKWMGAAYIRLQIFNIHIITFNAFFSKLWLILNGFVCLYIAGKLLGEDEES